MGQFWYRLLNKYGGVDRIYKNSVEYNIIIILMLFIFIIIMLRLFLMQYYI